MSAVEMIWAALEATASEHAYEVESERLYIEFGERVADIAALSTLDPILSAFVLGLRLRSADPLETAQGSGA